MKTSVEQPMSRPIGVLQRAAVNATAFVMIAAASNAQAVPLWKSAVSVAAYAVPFDSICAKLCHAALIDTTVRKATTNVSEDYFSLETLGGVESQSIRFRSRNRIARLARRFAYETPNPGTVRIALSVDSERCSRQRCVVRVYLLPSRSYGVVANVELIRQSTGWKVVKIELFEA